MKGAEDSFSSTFEKKYLSILFFKTEGNIKLEMLVGKLYY